MPYSLFPFLPAVWNHYVTQKVVLNPIFLVCRLACIFLDCIHTLHCKLPNPIFFAFIMHEIEVDGEFNLIYFFIMMVLFLQLLLAVGTKLEHVIIQLAHEVAEKHVAVQGDLVVRPSDDHFWFNKPKIVLLLIHIILFQNSFELAFFFWIWVKTQHQYTALPNNIQQITTWIYDIFHWLLQVQYGFDSCIMGQVGYIIPRLVIG